jgi:hypothetical protein
MASSAPNDLPPLYKDLEPIQRQKHGELKFHRIDSIPALATTHAVPLTVDEFVLAQRHYPIIFSAGDAPVPLALMALHEGTNTFFDKDGKPLEDTLYVPAYIRRYPFMLARLHPESDQLSLCVDPTSGAVGDFKDGAPLFDGDNPAEDTNEVLKFCEQFEQAAQRSNAFMQELQSLDLLMDGELTISTGEDSPPSIYRGFQMVDEEKFRGLSGDKLRKMNQSGMLPLVIAHLMSLSLSREIFARHMAQGTGPKLPETAQA